MPWARPGAAHTRDLEDVVAWLAQQMAKTPIAGLLRIGWDTVGRIVERVIEVVTRLDPIFKTLAPGIGDIPRTQGREGRDPRVEQGYIHAGPSGAGHFVKMIHNGIEYGIMQAYGEGFELLKGSQFDLDLGKIAHLWNQGSVVRSWLLELAESAFKKDPQLASIRGFVEDSGEGRWTVEEAVERGVPAPVLTLALFARFASRQEDSFSAKVIAALRNEFGGHAVKKE